MQQNFNLLDIQNTLNYTFKNPELIKTAFVHKSVDTANVQNNTRQVFLGEKLLYLLICDYVCTHSTAKGENQLNADFDIYIKALAPDKFIKSKSLTKYVNIAAVSEPLRESSTLCKELFYAIVSAIYKDGGLPALKGFLMPMLRCIGVSEHYEPALEGRVQSRADEALASEKHITNAKIRLGAKPSAISISKAATVNEYIAAEQEKAADKPSEKAKKESSLAKLLKKKEKNQEKLQEPEPELPEKTEPPMQKHFIRDPFAPVKLSDDLRNFKPKKQQKALATEVSAPALEDNHKSLLQETIQKNIRTPNVLIKYVSKPIAKNEWVATVTLSDNVIGSGKGENKKSAEKAAAFAAYSAIKADGTEENRFFLSLCTGEVADTAQSVDYVSKINQYFQKAKHLSSAPISYEKRNSRQKSLYMMAVIYEGREISAGKGASLKEAKQNAAKVACEVLNIK